MTLNSHLPKSAARRIQLVLRQTLLCAALFGVTTSSTAWAEITVSPAARGYDIDVTDPVSSTELIDAIAAALEIKVKGYPDESTVAANQLRGASLERALRALLPSARFVVRFNEDDSPAALIFLSAGKGGEPGLELSEPGGSMPPDDTDTYDGSEPSEVGLP